MISVISASMYCCSSGSRSMPLYSSLRSIDWFLVQIAPSGCVIGSMCQTDGRSERCIANVWGKRRAHFLTITRVSAVAPCTSAHAPWLDHVGIRLDAEPRALRHGEAPRARMDSVV